MYIPEHFAINDRQALVGLARNHSFAQLINVVENEPYISYLPLDIRQDNDQIWLYGHVAKANPHWHYFDGNTALAVFQGPHGYVSPTWYKSPQLVPTWNYCVVHMKGRVEALPDRAATRDIVEQLSDIHETENPDPWIPDYPEAMLDAIVGFRMRVNDIEGKYKLSQNRPQPDKQGVVNHLRRPFGKAAEPHHQTLSELILKHNPDVEA